MVAGVEPLLQVGLVLPQLDIRYAQLLEAELGSERVESDVRNLRLLSQAWYTSREDEKAIPPLTLSHATPPRELVVVLGSPCVRSVPEAPFQISALDDLAVPSVS